MTRDELEHELDTLLADGDGYSDGAIVLQALDDTEVGELAEALGLRAEVYIEGGQIHIVRDK